MLGLANHLLKEYTEIGHTEKKENYCNYLRQAYKSQHIISITVQEHLCIRLKKRESVLVL
ncbi:hypothetical protein BDC45DRAFT_528590 [Circinella umbellata]|nr:hypothetical protein BDC45DRAFT_528590 [Circinella umbellata]